MKNYFVQALENLTDNSGFMIWDNDYSTVEWIDLKTEAPTIEQIEAEIERIKAEEIAITNAKASRRAEILERLGLTEDEAKLILS